MTYLYSKSARRFGQLPFSVLTHQDLTHADHTVYAVIAGHRNHRTGKAWPSRETIAALAGMHPDSVSRSTRRLINAGVLERHQDGRGRGRSVVFTFPLIEGHFRSHDADIKPDRVVSEMTPALICLEKTIPTAPEAEPSTKVQSGESDLSLPTVPPAIIPALLAAIRGLPRSVQQLLIDEMAGAMRAKPVHNPVGYLRRLRQLHETGSLVPEHADQVKVERERRELIRRAVELASRRPPSTSSKPVSPGNVAAHIASLRRALH